MHVVVASLATRVAFLEKMAEKIDFNMLPPFLPSIVHPIPEDVDGFSNKLSDMSLKIEALHTTIRNLDLENIYIQSKVQFLYIELKGCLEKVDAISQDAHDKDIEFNGETFASIEESLAAALEVMSDFHNLVLEEEMKVEINAYHVVDSLEKRSPI